MNQLIVESGTVSLSSLFSALPGCSVLLLPNAPTFTIVAVTEGYLQATGRILQEVKGKGLFEVFPTISFDNQQSSEERAKASLLETLETKMPQHLSLRYDISGPDGSFEERHWSIKNIPVLDEMGNVSMLIHNPEDVTRQVRSARMEEAVRKMEKSYRELMSAPILMCILRGADYRIALANERTLQLWGRTNEVIGESIFEAIPELTGKGFLEILDEVKRTGISRQLYERPLTLMKNGKQETVYLDFTFQPYYETEQDRMPDGVLCVAHDQTIQVLARKQAEESEQRFRDLVAEADVATGVYFGREMRIQYANEAMLRLWGKDASVIGMTLREALPELEGQPFHGQLDHVFSTGETYWGKEDRGELLVGGKLQTYYFNFTYKALRNANGEIYGVLNMATDVTPQVLARKMVEQSELNLRNTILQSPVAMCILRGPSFVVNVANQKILEIWGKTEKEVVGKPVFEGLPEASNQGFEELLLQVYTKGERFIANERPINLPRITGIETCYINFVYEPFHEADNSVSGVIVVAIDVTEQVVARKRIEESETKYRSLFQSMEQAFCVIDVIFDEMGQPVDYRFEEVNGVFEVQTGLKNAVGKTVRQLLPNLENHWFQHYGNVALTGESVQFTEGSEVMGRWFDVNAFKIGGADSRKVALLFTDITSRKKSEEAIRLSEQRFQNLIRYASVGIIVLLGEDMIVSVVNAAYGQLINYSVDELLHKPLFHIIPEAEKAFRPIIDKVRTTGEPIFLYDQPYYVDGKGEKVEGYLNLVYQPFREADGTIVGVMVLCQNVTEQVVARKKIEEAQETAKLAIASAELGNFEVDLKTNVIVTSERFDEIFDVEHTGERYRYIDAIHSDDLPIRKKAYDRAYANGLLEYEARLIRKNGMLRWFRAKGRIFFDNNHHPVRLVGVAQDITEEKQFAEELSRQVQERTQEMEQFTYISHHDLQEPLRKIIMFTDMVRSDSYDLLSEASRSRLDKAMNAARRMSTALRDVLNYASLNKVEAFATVDLDEVLAAVQTDLELVIAEKKARVLSDELPTIRAVPQQMHQLFYNLLNNALKFTRPDILPVVNITCRIPEHSELMMHDDISHDRSYFLVTCNDNGIGFDQNFADKIFVLFQRLHTRDAYAGTGIGLALCRKVVSNHGGKIWAESKPGKGASFHILLPEEQ